MAPPPRRPESTPEAFAEVPTLICLTLGALRPIYPLTPRLNLTGAYPRVNRTPLRQGATWRRYCVALTFALGLAAASARAEVAVPAHAEPTTVIVGAASDSAPQSYLSDDGELEGFSVELLNAVARVMNLKLQRVVLPSSTIHEDFVHGKFDLLLSYGQTAVREEFADFTVPYLTLPGTLFVRRHENPVQVLADLDHRNVALIGQGSTGESFLKARGIGTHIYYAGNASQALQWVQEGRVDAAFVARLTALSIIEGRKLSNVVQLDVNIQEFDIRDCFAVHKGNSVLLARLNEGLAILHRTGEFDALYRKWYRRFDVTPGVTREQFTIYIAASLALGLVIALRGWLRQRSLRLGYARQAGELAEKEELLRALYENIPVAICVVEDGRDGHRLLAINRRAGQLFELSIEAASGRKLQELNFSPDWSAHLNEALRHWPAGSDLVREEHTLVESRRVIVMTLVPLAPGANGLRRVCVLTEDITERRQFDEELAQTRKLRAVGEMVGGIAHEFNNLLTPVMLKTSELQLNRVDDTPLQQDLTIIVMAVQRAAELTRRLLTFGRRSQTRAEAIMLKNVVTGAFDLLRPTMDRRLIWDNAVPTGLSPLFFNATDLNQILVNLLLNARDTLEDKIAALPPPTWHPNIKVEAVQLPAEAVAAPRNKSDRPLLGWQRLTVSDNGLGITPAARERIFEPFYTTKVVGRGTGLGLATVWHLTTEAGGRVEVESVAGESTSFHVFLPVWGLPPPPPLRIPSRGRPVAVSGKGRILVVEDEELVALTIVGALQRNGYQVHHIPDGLLAWEHLVPRLAEYDLLLLDVNLPGLDGIEIARRTRGASFSGPILIASGRLTASQLQALAQLQVSRVLAKPFDLPEFLTAIRECLGPA